jgi:hypothetical protein
MSDKPSKSVEALFGLLHRPGASARSVEEMDEAVGRLLVEDDERIRREFDSSPSDLDEDPEPSSHS